MTSWPSYPIRKSLTAMCALDIIFVMELATTERLTKASWSTQHLLSHQEGPRESAPLSFDQPDMPNGTRRSNIKSLPTHLLIQRRTPYRTRGQRRSESR